MEILGYLFVLTGAILFTANINSFIDLLNKTAKLEQINTRCNEENEIQLIIDSNKNYMEWKKKAFKSYSVKPRKDLLEFDNYRKFQSAFRKLNKEIQKIIWYSAAMFLVGLVLIASS
jgi:hypothetical protein